MVVGKEKQIGSSFLLLSVWIYFSTSSLQNKMVLRSALNIHIHQ